MVVIRTMAAIMVAVVVAVVATCASHRPERLVAGGPGPGGCGGGRLDRPVAPIEVAVAASERNAQKCYTLCNRCY